MSLYYTEVVDVSLVLSQRCYLNSETDDGSSDGSLPDESNENATQAAIKQLKNSRSSGADMVTAELLKLGEGGDSGAVVDPIATSC